MLKEHLQQEHADAVKSTEVEGKSVRTARAWNALSIFSNLLANRGYLTCPVG